MSILAIDPGPAHTAFVLWDGKVLDKGFFENEDFLKRLQEANRKIAMLGGTRPRVAVEMVACYGMPVGAEVFETCIQIGRIIQIIHPLPVLRAFRKDIKLHLCGTARAKDANIRQALIDRIGPQGVKSNPGPTYGLAKHDWAALAVAVYAADTIGKASQ